MGEGDWTSIQVFLLFLPGAIFPLTFFLKWLTFEIALRNMPRIPIRHVLAAGFIASVNPLLIAFTEFTIFSALDRAYIQVGLEFIIPVVFFSCLLLFNWAANHYIFAKNLNKYYSNYVLLTFAAAAIGTASFPLAWVCVDQLLRL